LFDSEDEGIVFLRNAVSLFDPEEQGVVLLRNVVSLTTNFSAFYLRQQNSS
jgi:hypothetical protein